MQKKIQNIKGMVDILPSQSSLWQWVEHQVEALFASFGYQEIRLPIAEKTELFVRGIGEVTDIVEKEMYTFADRNDDLMTLRPEGTAPCVRACQQHALTDNGQQQRLWYQGSMFRYERPQKGRQRQFHQVGVEAFNLDGASSDAEIILMSYQLWRRLGIDQLVTLEINSMGNLSDRNRFKQALVSYLTPLKDNLDLDSQKRLDTNPLRILDSKDSQTQALLESAPKIRDYLSDESAAHFALLLELLEITGIPYVLNDKLVRGFDYYNDTVFEWTTTYLGAQAAICGGGRYDQLVSQLGGKSTPAVGFALGMERLLLLLSEQRAGSIPHFSVDCYFAIACEGQDYLKAFAIAHHIRAQFPQLKMITHSGGGSLKSQLKKADKSHATYCLIIGSNEIHDNTIVLKPLRTDQAQQTVPLNELNTILEKLI